MRLCTTFLTILFCFEFERALSKGIKRPQKIPFPFLFFTFTQQLSLYKMGFSDFFGKDHEEVHSTSEEHKGKLSHELIAGAASYEAFKAYNEHCEKNGKPVEHAQAKQILAGFIGGAVDKLIETKGLDFIDKQKAKRHAEQQAEEFYNREYQ